ncbi:hypothetical protein [Pseudomonas azerbaijanoccidentalis]
MIVHIAIEIEADEKLKDVPNLVAKALRAKLSGKDLLVVDPVQRKSVDVRVGNVCAVYGDHDSKAPSD